MKLRLLFPVLLLSLFLFAPMSQAAPMMSVQPTTVQWFSGTFQQALAQARKEKKLILLDMYAYWCYPCKKYDRTVFNRADVTQYVHQHFVPVRRDGTRGEGRLLRRRYNCTTYPNILIISPDTGVEVDRLTKYMKHKAFLQQVENIRTGKVTLKALQGKLKKSPKDSVLHYRVGFRLAYRGSAASVRHLRYVANNPPKQFPHLAPRALYILGRIYYRNSRRDHANAVKVFREYLKRFPTARKAKRVRRLMIRSMRKL
jgi:thioredoxin-related protein